MGEAKRRGTYKERLYDAVMRDKGAEYALLGEESKANREEDIELYNQMIQHHLNYKDYRGNAYVDGKFYAS